ncbi:MAG: hypothetical protein JW885_11690 [Deltaproteobacteria bacterium]|nr:hypothetical protein [Candidatus Zymogenaceae bacterium]
MPMIRFDDDRYIARRDVTFLRPRVYLKDTGGTVIAAARADMTRLRRRITVYSDIDLTRPILTITGREIVGFCMRYDVTDTAARTPLGSVCRPGFLSTDRARWRLCDTAGREVARIRMTSAASLFSSALSRIVPRTWEVVDVSSGRVAAGFKEKWAAGGIECDVEFCPEGEGFLDRRCVVAGLMLLLYVR